LTNPKQPNYILNMQNLQNNSNSTWTGMIAIDDTELAVTDTGGQGIPIVYLNGQFANQGYWKKVIAELGTNFRHITYDERARGKSKKSADYSFATCVSDVYAILAARGVDKVLVVGWSYGAYIASHWVNQNSQRALGAVMVDAPYPDNWLDDAMERRIRKQFKMFSWFFPILRPFGITPQMSADQCADINIELGRVSSESELFPILENIKVPLRYVVATGKSMGNQEGELDKIRASLDSVIASNPKIKISAKVPSNHDAILTKDFRAVADTVREIIALS
jgi:pimeloyl-ACP methyl ester carboxylesterase